MTAFNNTTSPEDIAETSITKPYAPIHVTTIYVLINVFVVIINSFHLLIITMNDKLFSFSKNHRTFLMLLAVLDLLLGFFRMIFSNQKMQQAFVDHNWLCVLSQIVVQGLMISAFGVILLMAFDRVIATRATYAENWYVRHFKWMNLAFCLVVFAIYGGIAIAWHNTGAYKIKGLACCDIRRRERITLVFAWIVQFFTIIFYAGLLYAIRFKSSSGNSLESNTTRRIKMEIVRVLGYLLLVHFLMLAVTTTSVFVKNLPFWWWFRFVCASALALNPLFDPIVYGVVSKEYRKKLSSLSLRSRSVGIT